METSQILKSAWRAVQDAELPQHLHDTAFAEAVRLLSHGSPSPELSAPSSPNGGARSTTSHTPAKQQRENNGEVATSSDSEELMYRLVSEHTGVDKDQLERLVHLDDDGPRISIAGIKLGRTNNDQAKAAAQILAIVRGFGLGESETPFSIIRAECERLKIYNSRKFAGQLASIDGFSVAGSGQNRRLRPRGAGIQAFPRLVESLLGETATT